MGSERDPKENIDPQLRIAWALENIAEELPLLRKEIERLRGALKFVK
jgi:hypothetical protein